MGLASIALWLISAVPLVLLSAVYWGLSWHRAGDIALAGSIQLERPAPGARGSRVDEGRPRLSTLQWWALTGFVVAGAAVGVLCLWIEERFWQITGLSLRPGRSATSSLVAMLALAAPLEEGAKLVLVWPALTRRWLLSSSGVVLAAAAASTGFALAETLCLALGWPSIYPIAELVPLRLLLMQVAHVFFACCWAYFVLSGAGAYGFRLAWLVATGFHGLFDHLVLWRGAGTLVATAPILLAMGAASWLALLRLRVWALPSWPAIPNLSSGVSLEWIQRSLRARDQPVMIHWIVLGAFVTVGVMLSSVVLAVYFGHQLGLDFSLANEAEVRSNGPLVLLSAAALAAFPIAAYLVARASGTRSVLEPAMSSLVAIFSIVGLLSLTAPVMVVFVIAVAPVAFALACLGAWFGLIH